MSTRLDRERPGCRRHDEAGTALVELALVIPLVMLLLGAAFNGWNGMQESIRLTSAARAGAIVAASDLTSNSGHTATTQSTALADATTAINAEEGATNVYQSTDSGANNYVSIALTPNETISGSVTISVVTITISHASVSFVPFVGSFPVTTHATARYA
ncbi:MAG TPA: TadE/TadG family type IV pilus assembly protein [Acidimicrobiales bacterium]|nr:TadE/TadG family type IV pilus assembly protein [Acidimicrobiales bacterium]